MKYVVVVDSMASVPEHVLKNRDRIKVIPLNITIGSERFLDPVDNKSLLRFYSKNRIDAESTVDATSPTHEQIMVHLLNDVVPSYDFAVCQTTSALLSVVYASFDECAQSIDKEAKVLRDMAKISQPFQMHCVNSGTSSSGQTLLALYSDAILSKETDMDLCLRKIDQFKSKIRTYSVIKDILYARKRLKFVGFKSISFATAVSKQLRSYSPIIKISNDKLKPTNLKLRYDQATQKVFKYAEDCIDSGLYMPIINIAYAGLLKELHEMESFKSLQAKAKANGVTVVSGMMSVAGCINYSPGSISMGIAPKDEISDPK